MATETQATAAASGAGATARLRENKHIAAGTSQERVSALAGRLIKAPRAIFPAGGDPVAPQGDIMTATGNTDTTAFPPPQLPSARLEPPRAGVLTHTPWAGWYYETDPD